MEISYLKIWFPGQSLVPAPKGRKVAALELLPCTLNNNSQK